MIRNIRLFVVATVALIATFGATSCEDNTEPQGASAAIILDSEASLVVASTGLESAIIYHIKNPKEGVNITAKPDADWVTIFSTAHAGKVLFAVAPNATSESRQATITLQYDSAKQYVRIRQNGAGQDQPEFTITSDSEVALDRNNHTVDVEYRIDLATQDGYIYAFADAEWVYACDTAEEGVVHVKVRPNYTTESRTATVTIGYEHVRKTVSIEQSAEGERRFTADILHGIYYGDQITAGVGNYWFFLTDEGFDELGRYKPYGTYYRVDAYGPMATVVDGKVVIPEGSYTFDTANSFSEWTFSAEYASFMYLDSTGQNSVELLPERGTLVVEKDRLYIEWNIAGEQHTVIYEGTPEIADESATQLVYSTLDADYEATLDDHYMLYANYGDYYNYGYQNWIFVIKPNDDTGDCFQFDIIAHPTIDEGFVGTFTASDTLAPMSFIPGWVGGHLEGSWYFTVDQERVAPFRTGEVSVSQDSEGVYTIDISATDDRGYLVTASWSGVGEDATPAPETASLVMLNVATSVQPRADRK